MEELYTCGKDADYTTLLQGGDGALVVRDYGGSEVIVRPAFSAEEAREILIQIYSACKQDLQAEAAWNAEVREASIRDNAFCQFWSLIAEALEA